MPPDAPLQRHPRPQPQVPAPRRHKPSSTFWRHPLGGPVPAFDRCPSPGKAPTWQAFEIPPEPPGIVPTPAGSGSAPSKPAQASHRPCCCKERGRHVFLHPPLDPGTAAEGLGHARKHGGGLQGLTRPAHGTGSEEKKMAATLPTILIPKAGPSFLGESSTGRVVQPLVLGSRYSTVYSQRSK